MSTKNWLNSHGGDFLSNVNWSDGVAPMPGDVLLIHRGYAVATNDILNQYTIYLGSTTPRSMAGLELDNSVAQVSLEWKPDPWEYAGAGMYPRYEWIGTTLDSTLTLTDGARGAGGSTHTSISLATDSNLILTESLSNNASVSIVGPGNLENRSTSLFNSNEYVGVNVTGQGVWNLAGNDTIEFVSNVSAQQGLTAMANSTITIDHTDRYLGSINTVNFVGKLLLNGIQADSATFANDILAIGTNGRPSTDIRFEAGTATAPEAFDVYKTTAGAVLVDHGTVKPSGAGDLLLSQPATV